MNKKLYVISLVLIALAGALWLLYLSVAFVVGGTVVSIGFGLALLGLAGSAAWLLIAQLSFALRADRLAKQMLSDGDRRCYPDVELSPSGRVLLESAYHYRDERLQDVEASPDDWRSWYLLAIGHEMARDHRHAIIALKRASQLQSAECLST